MVGEVEVNGGVDGEIGRVGEDHVEVGQRAQRPVAVEAPVDADGEFCAGGKPAVGGFGGWAGGVRGHGQAEVGDVLEDVECVACAEKRAGYGVCADFALVVGEVIAAFETADQAPEIVDVELCADLKADAPV